MNKNTYLQNYVIFRGQYQLNNIDITIGKFPWIYIRSLKTIGAFLTMKVLKVIISS